MNNTETLSRIGRVSIPVVDWLSEIDIVRYKVSLKKSIKNEGLLWDVVKLTPSDVHFLLQVKKNELDELAKKPVSELCNRDDNESGRVRPGYSKRHDNNKKGRNYVIREGRKIDKNNAAALYVANRLLGKLNGKKVLGYIQKHLESVESVKTVIEDLVTSAMVEKHLWKKLKPTLPKRVAEDLKNVTILSDAFQVLEEFYSPTLVQEVGRRNVEFGRTMSKELAKVYDTSSLVDCLNLLVNENQVMDEFERKLNSGGPVKPGWFRRSVVLSTLDYLLQQLVDWDQDFTIDTTAEMESGALTNPLNLEKFCNELISALMMEAVDYAESDFDSDDEPESIGFLDMFNELQISGREQQKQQPSAAESVLKSPELLGKILGYSLSYSFDIDNFDPSQYSLDDEHMYDELESKAFPLGLKSRLVNKTWFEVANKELFRECEADRLELLYLLTKEGFNDYSHLVTRAHVSIEYCLIKDVGNAIRQLDMSNLQQLDIIPNSEHFTPAQLQQFVTYFQKCTGLRKISVGSCMATLVKFLPMVMRHFPNVQIDMEIYEGVTPIDHRLFDTILTIMSPKFNGSQVKLKALQLCLFWYEQNSNFDTLLQTMTSQENAYVVPYVESLILIVQNRNFKSSWLKTMEQFAPSLKQFTLDRGNTNGECSRELLKLLKKCTSLEHLKIDNTEQYSNGINDAWVDQLTKCTPNLETLTLNICNKVPAFTIQTFKSLKRCRSLRFLDLQCSTLPRHQQQRKSLVAQSFDFRKMKPMRSEAVWFPSLKEFTSFTMALDHNVILASKNFVYHMPRLCKVRLANGGLYQIQRKRGRLQVYDK